MLAKISILIIHSLAIGIYAGIGAFGNVTQIIPPILGMDAIHYPLKVFYTLGPIAAVCIGLICYTGKLLDNG